MEIHFCMISVSLFHKLTDSRSEIWVFLDRLTTWVSLRDPDNLICVFFFPPDCNESFLFSSHWTWTLTDLPLHLPGNLLPFQVSHPASSSHALQTGSSYSLRGSISPRRNVAFLFSQEFKLPKDHAPQKPLLFFCSELCHHHHLVDRSGEQPGAGAEESGEFMYLFIVFFIIINLNFF